MSHSNCYECGCDCGAHDDVYNFRDRINDIEEWWNQMPSNVLRFIQDEQYQEYHEMYDVHSKMEQNVFHLKDENYKLEIELQTLQRKLAKLKSHHKMKEQIKKELGIK